MIRPSGWTRRWAAIDPAGSGGGGSGDGVHEVPVEPQGDRGADVGSADLVLLAVEVDVPVALDLAVELDGLPGAQDGLPGPPCDRGPGRLGVGRAGAAHGEVGQVLGQEPGRGDAQQVPVQEQVDAVDVGPDGQGPPGEALLEGEVLAAGDDDEVPAGRDAAIRHTGSLILGQRDLELDAITGLREVSHRGGGTVWLYEGGLRLRPATADESRTPCKDTPMRLLRAPSRSRLPRMRPRLRSPRPPNGGRNPDTRSAELPGVSRQQDNRGIEP